jgi:hypothetical protein
MEVLQSRGGEFLADFFSGAAATPLNVALTRVIGRMRGQRPSPERFVDAVVRELIQGGIVQLIMGAVTHGAAARAARANAPDAPTPGGAAPNAHGPDTHAPVAEARAAGGSSPPGGGGPHAPATADATPDLGPIIGYTPSNAPVYRNGPRPEGRWLGLDRLWHMSDGSTARPGLGTVPTSGEIGRLPAADMVRDREGRFWSANNEVFPAGSGANRARGAFVVDAPIASPIRYDQLGRDFELSGGHIKNAVIRAAWFAAELDRPISETLLRLTAHLEVKQLGGVVRDVDVGRALEELLRR